TASLGLSFERLVWIDVLIYGASLVLEFLALIVLRVREPEMPRPFRAPGGLAGVIIIGLVPTVLLTVALVRNRTEQIGRFSSLSFALVVMALGPLVYWFANARRLRSLRAER